MKLHLSTARIAALLAFVAALVSQIDGREVAGPVWVGVGVLWLILDQGERR